MKTILFILSLLVATTVTGQTFTLTLSFAPSEFVLSTSDSAEIATFITEGYTAISVVGYANSLPNLNGMSNETLAQVRAQSVMGLLNEVPTSFVVGETRIVTITFTKVDGNKQYAAATNDTIITIPTTDTITATVNAFDNKVDTAFTTVYNTTVVPTTIDTAAITTTTTSTAVNKTVKHTSVYALRLADHIEADRFHGYKQCVTWNKAKEFKDSIWHNRRNIIRKGNFGYRMWVLYDAKRSHSEGRHGAVFPNGGGYHTLSWWGINGRKHRNDVITKHGREIPFMGFDKKEYEKYYMTNSVFPKAGNNGGKVKTKVISYSQAGSINKVKKAREKAQYFFRSLTACRN